MFLKQFISFIKSNLKKLLQFLSIDFRFSLQFGIYAVDGSFIVIYKSLTDEIFPYTETPNAGIKNFLLKFVTLTIPARSYQVVNRKIPMLFTLKM